MGKEEPKKNETKKVAIGDLVYFTLDAGPSAGQVRPAIALKVNDDDTLDLYVFLSPYDRLNTFPVATWLAVARGKEGSPRTWAPRA